MEAASHLELEGIVYPACTGADLGAGAQPNAAALAAGAQGPSTPGGFTPAQIAAYQAVHPATGGGGTWSPSPAWSPPAAAGGSSYQAAAGGGGWGPPAAPAWYQSPPAANALWTPASFGRKLLGARAHDSSPLCCRCHRSSQRSESAVCSRCNPSCVGSQMLYMRYSRSCVACCFKNVQSL